MHRPHLAPRDIQAWVDGETRGVRFIVIKRHLHGCEACRSRVAITLRDQVAASQLLGALPGPINTDDAWAQVTVRSGGAAERYRSPGRAGWYVAGLGTGAIAAALAAFFLVSGRRDAPLHVLGAEVPVKETRQSDRLFVERLDGLLRSGEAHLIENRCCDDHDGEGPADDGTVLIGFRRSATPIVVLYEDRDGSGSLTAGDIVRLVSRGSEDSGREAPFAPTSERVN